MSYSHGHTFGPGSRLAGRQRTTEPIDMPVRRLRLAIGIAAVLLLVVFAALGERSAPESATDTSVSESVTPSEPAFDGRGKWGGYVR